MRLGMQIPELLTSTKSPVTMQGTALPQDSILEQADRTQFCDDRSTCVSITQEWAELGLAKGTARCIRGAEKVYH